MIFFKTVRWKNIFSYGDRFTEIQLDRSPSTLITGENGSGKSTILEAVSFALFGKPFRRVKKGDIVNSKNGREAVVEIEFEHRMANKTDQYKIVRGIKPEIFEIYKNGRLENQNSQTKDYQQQLQTQVLKCDINVFSQIVLVGEATHTSFMRMKSGERRVFVETILNLNVFSQMNKLHSVELSSLKERSQQLKLDYSLKEQELNFKKSRIEDMEKAVIKIAEAENNRVIHEIVSLEEEISSFQETIDELNAKILTYDDKDTKSLTKKLTSVKDLLSKASFKITALNQELKKLEDTHVCHACHQDIPEAMKKTQLEKIIQDLSKIKDAKKDLENKEEELEIELSEKNVINEKNDVIKKDISSTHLLLLDRQARIQKLKQQTAQSSSPVDYKEEIEDNKELIKKLELEFEELKTEGEKLSSDLEYHNLIKTMLQDNGIKASMIKRFIPIINQTINHNLSKLGFFGRFTLDENFEESIMARGFDNLSYNSYSEGEKLRIDLAVLLAWRDMARMQGILTTNLLMFDEVIDASMDTSGTEAFTSLLSALHDTNVFIISHSPEKIIDKVRSQISFTKGRNGFSKMITPKND